MRSESRAALEGLLEQWFVQVEAGEQPDVAQICAQHPDLREDFERLLSCDLQFAQTFAGRRPEVGKMQPVRRIGDFEVLTLLGSGGRGEVYLARQISLGRFVALKLLRTETASDSRAQRRLLREAGIAASLEHPNIVPIYSVGKAEQQTYVAMKWLSGPALDELEERLAPERIAEIGSIIARALHAAHCEGVTHRDVKPANLMLDDGTPYILDFGLAQALTDQTATVDGPVSGTLPFMSPEQLCSSSDNTPLDGRSDVYALAATLFELVEGVAPFSADSPGALIKKILLHSAPLARSCDRDFATILARALEKDPAQRFPSAEAFAQELDRYRRGEAILSRRIGPLGRFVKLARRHPRASWAASIAGLAILVTAGLLYVRIAKEGENRHYAVQRIRSELRSSRPGVASTLLEGLEQSAPGDPRLPRLRQELRAHKLLSLLLDRIQLPLNAQDGAATQELLDAIRSTQAFEPGTEQERLWLLARAAALTLLGEAFEPEARKALAQVASLRVRQAFEALLSKRPWPWKLPTSSAADSSMTVIEHLLTAIAMRAADCPVSAQREEIQQGLALDETNYRLRFQDLIWQSIHEERPAVVLAGLRGLAREKRYSLAVRGAMLREALRLNDEKLVREQLERLEAGFPRRDWTQIQAAIVTSCYARMGLDEKLQKMLVWAQAKWPQACFFALAALRFHARHGNLELSTADLQRAKSCAGTAEEKEDSLLAEAFLALFKGRLPGLSDRVKKARLRRCRRQALDLAGTSKRREVRARAFYLAASTVQAIAKPGEAGSGIMHKALEYLDKSLAEVESGETLMLGLQLAQAAHAWERMAQYLERFEASFAKGALIDPIVELNFLCMQVYYAAYRKKDREAVDLHTHAVLTFKKRKPKESIIRFMKTLRHHYHLD